MAYKIISSEVRHTILPDGQMGVMRHIVYKTEAGHTLTVDVPKEATLTATLDAMALEAKFAEGLAAG